MIRYVDDPSCLTVDYCYYVPVRSKFTHSSSLRNMAYRGYIVWTLSVYVLIGKTLTCQGICEFFSPALLKAYMVHYN